MWILPRIGIVGTLRRLWWFGSRRFGIGKKLVVCWFEPVWCLGYGLSCFFG